MAARANHVDYMSFSISYKILFLTFVLQQLVGGVFDLEARFTIKDSSDLVILLELLGHCNVSLKVRDFLQNFDVSFTEPSCKKPRFSHPKNNKRTAPLESSYEQSCMFIISQFRIHYRSNRTIYSYIGISGLLTKSSLSMTMSHDFHVIGLAVSDSF